MASPLTAEAAQRAAAADVAAVLAALAKTSGNVGAAADLLGIPRRTLDRRIVTLGLREHLSATYPRAGRQPRKPQMVKPLRPPGKREDPDSTGTVDR